MKQSSFRSMMLKQKFHNEKLSNKRYNMESPRIFKITEFHWPNTKI